MVSDPEGHEGLSRLGSRPGKIPEARKAVCSFFGQKIECAKGSNGGLVIAAPALKMAGAGGYVVGTLLLLLRAGATPEKGAGHSAMQGVLNLQRKRSTNGPGCGKLNSMKQTLAQSNPYLQKPEIRDAAVQRSVTSSSAIEGIRVSLRKAKAASGTTAIKTRKVRGSGKSPR